MKALEERDGWDRRMRGVRGWAGMVSAWRRVLGAEDEREGERYLYRVERGLEGDVKSHKWGLAIEIAMGEVEVRRRWGGEGVGCGGRKEEDVSGEGGAHPGVSWVCQRGGFGGGVVGKGNGGKGLVGRELGGKREEWVVAHCSGASLCRPRVVSCGGGD